MANWDQPIDTPGDWQREHLRRYVATNGADGHMWNLPWRDRIQFPDAPTLLLTTLGRRSGKARRTPLIYGRDQGRYLVVASQGGAPTHPAWYLNLTANAQVRIQVGSERFDARAATATAEEKPRLWRLMADIWPPYEEYQSKTTRLIPVVIIEPSASIQAS